MAKYEQKYAKLEEKGKKTMVTEPAIKTSLL